MKSHSYGTVLIHISGSKKFQVLKMDSDNSMLLVPPRYLEKENDNPL